MTYMDRAYVTMSAEYANTGLRHRVDDVYKPELSAGYDEGVVAERMIGPGDMKQLVLFDLQSSLNRLD
jgi:hypothetical protein